MPAFFLTAAEIAAAEAAAIAAAEAAAVAAAEAAAIQAAQVAAAEAATQAAATAAAEQAAAQAATQASTSGIQTLAQEVAASPPTGIDQLTQAFQNVNPPPMSQAEFLNNSLAGANTPFNPVTNTFNPAQPFANPAYASAAPPAVPAMTPPAAPTPVDYGLMQTQGLSAPLNTAPPSQYSLGSQVGNYSLTGPAAAPPAPEPNFLQSAFKEFKDMSLPNKLLTGLAGTTGYEMLNRPKPEEKKKYKSSFRPDLYTGYTPVQPTPYPYPVGYAVGGIADLGGYSDYARGGRMLKGPGDGMSDDIPATIAGNQPARLANEEFVIPADVVSHLGNGSSEAGAKQLYKMMDRIRKARTGTKKQGKQINPEKYLA